METGNEVDVVTSPALRFGRELARSRAARDWSQVRLAKQMGYTNGYISLIERGKRALTFTFAVKADEVFGTGARFQELWRLYSNASLVEGFAEYVEAEARCRVLRTFQLGVVPSQFQTPAYASALAMAAARRGDITVAQAEARVAFLQNRQQIFRRPTAPLVHAVLDEGCIRRVVGGPEVMADQLAYLEALASSPQVVLQIAPFDLGERVPFRMPVVLLTLPDRSVLGYAESLARGYMERGRETVASWSKRYDLLLVESLSTVASLAMIRTAREELA
ncbi:helix-turn-helix domain-containing protein [Kitasatospora cineracea]|uniref:Helix-turn-helix protein n=1 Tax=Kitasatospora cineracea TaxID=88074 RepID=A0A3N4RX33_9ACTN|nr:helix-turn-helix transcriptional regulator [Kitasatospora cineracea]RPE33007.1 helix-turn-helix protein [Kitasatospora cineracea]